MWPLCRRNICSLWAAEDASYGYWKRDAKGIHGHDGSIEVEGGSHRILVQHQLLEREPEEMDSQARYW